MFAPASVAAVAANAKGTRFGHLAAEAENMPPYSSSKTGAPASKAIAARFAWTNPCSSSRSFKPVHGAAATRKSLPSFNARSGGAMVTVGSGSSRWRFSGESSNHSPPGHQLCLPRECCLNPSLERTSTGKALGPRGARVYAAPRGPSASPAPAAQLKR